MIRMTFDPVSKTLQVVDPISGVVTSIGGSVGASGSAVVDFGDFPGANEAMVVVTDQTAITASSVVTATIGINATVKYSAEEMRLLASLMTVSCTTPIDGVGFTIFVRSTERMQYQFVINWKW